MAESMPLHYLLAAVARRIACGLLSHDWRPAGFATDARYCPRCKTAEGLAAAPPPGHPDTIPAPVDQHGETYLAWLETEFTGKAA